MRALIRGYVLFRVNDEWFFSYSRAKARRVELCDARQSVSFLGLNLFLGWRGFFLAHFGVQTPECEL